MRKTHAGFLLLVLALLAGLQVAGWAEQAPWDWSREATIEPAAEEFVANQSAFVDDAEALARVQRVLVAVVAQSEFPDAQYKISVIGDKEANAFAVPGALKKPDGAWGPGGHLYLTTGLLRLVRSDHELAGVLAHEVAHACHHDVIRQIERDAKMQEKSALLIALVGAFAASGQVDTASLLYLAGEVVRIASQGGYSIALETEADTTTVGYLAKSGYSPVGLLTFLEEMGSSPSAFQPDPGIERTHPDYAERVVNVIRVLHREGIPINRRLATNAPAPEVVQAEVNGTPVYQVKVDQVVVFSVPVGEEQAAALDRAERAAGTLGVLMRDNLESYEVQPVAGQDGTAGLDARGKRILTVTPDDAQFFGRQPLELAVSYREALRKAFWLESFRTLVPLGPAATGAVQSML
jgi:Zn-dependent protease with chaperone function